MLSFIMKARTVSNVGWYTFSIEDIPVLVHENSLSLMRIPNSPLLCLNTVRKGDRDTMFFEGEIVQHNGVEWLICYERGFYAINKDYVVCKLEDLEGATKIGDYGIDYEFPISLSIKQKLLFKYKNTIFRIESICGSYQGNILLRSSEKPINPSLIKQDCGCMYNKEHLYLGDVTTAGTVSLENGILGFIKDNVFTSVESMRKQDGCN